MSSTSPLVHITLGLYYPWCSFVILWRLNYTTKTVRQPITNKLLNYSLSVKRHFQTGQREEYFPCLVNVGNIIQIPPVQINLFSSMLKIKTFQTLPEILRSKALIQINVVSNSVTVLRRALSLFVCRSVSQ